MDFITRSSRSRKEHDKQMPPSVGQSKLPIRSGGSNYSASDSEGKLQEGRKGKKVHSKHGRDHSRQRSRGHANGEEFVRGDSVGGGGSARMTPRCPDPARDQVYEVAGECTNGRVTPTTPGKKLRSKSKDRERTTATKTAPQMFLPPSHYAAAAGMQIPDRIMGVDSGLGRLPDTDLQGTGVTGTGTKNMISMSYPSRPPSPLTEEFHIVSHVKEDPGNGSSSKSNEQAKRQQNSNDTSVPSRPTRRRSSTLELPELEKDLLPSLRDTVYRMTRNSATPSPNLGSESGQSSAYMHIPQSRLPQPPVQLLSPTVLSERSSSLPRPVYAQTSPLLSGSVYSPSLSLEVKSPRTETTIEKARRAEQIGDREPLDSSVNSGQLSNEHSNKPKSILKKRSESKSPCVEEVERLPSGSRSVPHTPRAPSRNRFRKQQVENAFQDYQRSPLLSTDTVGRERIRCDDEFSSRSIRHKASGIRDAETVQRESKERKSRPSKSGRTHAGENYYYRQAEQQVLAPANKSPETSRKGSSSRLPVRGKDHRTVTSIPSSKSIVGGTIVVDSGTETESSSDAHDSARLVHANKRGQSSSGRESSRRSRSHSRSRSRSRSCASLQGEGDGPSPRVRFTEGLDDTIQYDSDASRARRQGDLANLVARIGTSPKPSQSLSPHWSRTPNVSSPSAASSLVERGVGRRRSRSLVDTPTHIEKQEDAGLALDGSATTLQSLERNYSVDCAYAQSLRRHRASFGQDHISDTHQQYYSNHPGESQQTASNAYQTSNVIGSERRSSLLFLNAERQREAFGIPPSSSVLYNTDEGLVSGESQYSITDDVVKHEDDGGSGGVGLSSAAEQLFQTLGEESSSNEAVEALARVSRAASPITPSETSSSVYDEDGLNDHTQNSGLGSAQTSNYQHANNTWRGTLSESAFASLCERYGKMEMHRQGLIWELCESEQHLVKQLQTALQVYVHPLLGKDRTWMKGLPTLITRFLDWLDDIFQLHSQIHSALHQARSTQYPVILRIAEALRPFIPRLEVYQPYVARLDEVLAMIEGLTRNGSSDFGEFIRIQDATQAAIGMDMALYLRLPTKRLGIYLETFRKLLLLTPNTHVDHLPTFSLLHSGTMVVNVMWEVKLREDEYNFIKDVARRIHGLPESAQLARRERRLLAHGPLQRVYLSEHARQRLEKEQDLQSEMSDATSASSMSASSSSSSVDRTATNNKYPLGVYSPRNGLSQSPRPGSPEKTKSSLMHAFVFTDLVLFTIPIIDATSSQNRQHSWRLPSDIGMCRVLSVGYNADCMGYDHLIGLHVLPVKLDEIDSGVLIDNEPTSIYVHVPRIPEDSSVPITPSLNSAQSSRERWLDAIRQCHEHTLRSLSFPSHSGHFLAHGPNLDLEHDTRQSVMSLLASGLPLPKSPSLQIEEVRERSADDPALREREERGWWALRYQQVLRELQRYSPLATLSSNPVPLHELTRVHRTVSSPRALKLGNPSSSSFLRPPNRMR